MSHRLLKVKMSKINFIITTSFPRPMFSCISYSDECSHYVKSQIWESFQISLPQPPHIQLSQYYSYCLWPLFSFPNTLGQTLIFFCLDNCNYFLSGFPRSNFTSIHSNLHLSIKIRYRQYPSKNVIL